MSLIDRSTRDLLAAFSSSDPTPGGGSAAALAGALGAALVSMVCAMPKTRTGAAPERARLDAALAWAREAGERLRTLVEEDTRAYDAVVAAYRKPKATEDQKVERRSAIEAASCPVFRAFVEREVEKVNTGLARYETIKRFLILPGEFTIDGGELTPTLKLKRRVVHAKYAEEIDAIYAG
jgi:formiminotetrahydrofolate cyclodeaminase